MSTTLKIAIGSLIIGTIVLGLKLLAWYLTGSAALYSDALESTVNLATALAALVAIRIAALPPDANHPFGHHKAEFFSAVLEGVMIIVAAVFILMEAYEAFLHPRSLDAPMEGLLINSGATLLNGFWAFVLMRQGRALRSPALAADGRHLWTDVITSFGVVAGVGLAVMTGWWWLDPLVAGLVALNIVVSGWKVVAQSLSGLMDEAVPEDAQEKIREIISAEAGGAVEAHDLRTRHAGSATFVEFHLVVPGEMTVFDAHEICDHVESALEKVIDDLHVTIHVEPEHKSKQTGILVL